MRDVVLCEGSLGVVIPFNCDKCGGLIEQREHVLVRVFDDNSVERLCERCYKKRASKRINEYMEALQHREYESLNDIKVAVFDALCTLFPGESTDVLDEKAMGISMTIACKIGSNPLRDFIARMRQMEADGDVVVLSPDNPEQMNEVLKRIFGEE